MATTTLDVVVIGAGQAGLSISQCLSAARIEHLVLERRAIADSWQSARWSSFCLVTPNWAIHLAGRSYDGSDPHGFMARDEVVAWLQDYAVRFDVPVKAPVEVESVTRRGDDRFELRTQHNDTYVCRAVVVATATHAHASVPAFAKHLDERILQLHASEYQNPESLPEGGVLVVGSAQSGCQFADELNRAGKDVTLATGLTGRLPRRYRGADIITWQRDMGFLDRPASALAEPAHRFRPDPHLTGAGGGRTLDLRDLSQRGVQLGGRMQGVDGLVATFDSDLEANLTFADEFAAQVLADVDRYIATAGIAAPAADENNSDLGFDGERFIPAAPASIDLRAADINTVLWATGFRHDFSWVHAPVFDAFAYPVQSGGRTAVPGLHFLGLNYVERRGSGILYGVGEDARTLSRVITAELGAT